MLNGLGDLDRIKAPGLFKDNDVANYPGDLGMKTIAERFFEEVKKLI